MKINSNIQAMIAGNVLRSNEAKQSSSTEKMSSGYRINRAKDNPAGMAITNRMRAQIANLNKANQNSSNAINVIETADGAMGEIQNIVQRISELTIKAGNDITTEEDRMAIQREIDQLTTEIERIARDTEYNGQGLLNGDQRLKGYSSELGVTVENYDPDFPLGDDFVVSLKDGRTWIDKDSISIKKGGEELVKTDMSNVDVDGNRITLTMDDGSELILSADNVSGQKKIVEPSSLSVTKDGESVAVRKEVRDGSIVFTDGGDFNLEIKADTSIGNGQAVLDTKNVEATMNGERVNLSISGNRISFTDSEGSRIQLTSGSSFSNYLASLELNGVGGMKIQVGASGGQEINIAIPKISLINMGIDKIDVRTTEGARKAIEQTKKALSFTSSVRARLGAYENRFEKVISNLDVTTENLTKSYSTIKDVDMADEMVEYTTLQVLVQAGTSMLSQANEQPQQALQLLQ
jgi:flagellin